MPGSGGALELIDGQQRLTTLLLVLSALKYKFNVPLQLKYTIDYVTRGASEKYIRSLAENFNEAELRKNEYIDFRYLYNAYCCIVKWFEEHDNAAAVAFEFFLAFSRTVKVLWYEAQDDDDGRELFKRLNVGRIPLTNAELVKALFLNRDSLGDNGRLRQDEIAAQWERLEKEMHDEAFWAFLTNDRPTTTRRGWS